MAENSLSIFLAGDSVIMRPWSHVSDPAFLQLIDEIRAADVSITNLGPERADNISPTGWVLERGMRFGSHHDAPVALPDSMRVLSATVTRRSRSGDILGPGHRVPVAVALKALTIWPAWQHFEEKAKGSIEVGKLADLVVLSGNPLIVPEDQLDDLKVLETIKEGISIYRRPDKLSSGPSAAMFGITPGASHCTGDDHGGVAPVCGDGCFNHGLRMLVDAINGEP